MKNSLGQRDALSYETGLQKAGFIGRILDYNLPANYVDQQNKILTAITKPELDALAKKLLKSDQMFVLLVGDKAKILEGVKKSGYEVIEMDVGNIKIKPVVSIQTSPAP
jgi:zinc protease